MTASFEVRNAADAENPELVKLRLDRPGVAAVSYTGSAEQIILDVAAAAGLEVEIRDVDDDIVVEGPQETPADVKWEEKG